MRLIKDRKGQITVFIILGIVLLFAFLFIFQIVEQLQTGKLKQEEEKVLGRLFGKEGLRLYVESCLEKELEEGLKLIGRQGGKLWQEQPGGRDSFEENFNGLTYLNQEKVSYALTKGFYPVDNQYPCQGNVPPPAFCRYRYPNSSILPGYPVKFGENKLFNFGVIQSGLEKFLKERTAQCVEELIQAEISSALKISAENIEINIRILKEGIKAEVSYPLTISSAGEEFFHLAEFDFFYPSKFYQLLDAAILNPLNLDWSFVDFDYKKESLGSLYFEHASFDAQGAIITHQEPMKKEEYEGLALTFEKKELGFGDALFQFTADNILKNQPYLFQFARQNRPPALDYIEKDACEEDGYDYLALAGKESINIEPLAFDPDEDLEINYGFEADPYLSNEGSEGQFLATNPDPDWYVLKVNASDEHGASDWQNVRILVDRPLQTKVSLEMPYTNIYYQGEKYAYSDLMALSTGNTYWLSKEDPVLVKVTLPGRSRANQVTAETRLWYDQEEDFNYILPESLSLEEEGGCFSLPWLKTRNSQVCEAKEMIDYYSEDLKDWPVLLDSFENYSHFRKLTPEGEKGKLSLNFEIAYCRKEPQSDSQQVEIEVRECVPHQNPTHPWAYPYQNYKYGTQENGETDFDNYLGEEELNPFLATHSCCRPSDWSVYRKEDNRICFKGPEELGCFGGSSAAKAYPGYLLEKRTQKANCDGQRGNLCGGEPYFEYESLALCGDGNIYQTGEGKCNKVALKCKNKKPFYYETGENGFWCHGDLGCGLAKNACTSVIVSDSGLDFTNLNSVNYHCGCKEYREGDPGDETKRCLSLTTGKEGYCGPSGNCG